MSDAGDPGAVEVGVDLRALVMQLSRRLRAGSPFPSSAQASVLGRLLDEGPQTASMLAAAEGVRHQSMAQTIGDLEAAELVVRVPDSVDRRRVFLHLTESGHAALLANRRARDAWFRAALAALFTAEERRLLADAIPLLSRLAAGPQGAPARRPRRP